MVCGCEYESEGDCVWEEIVSGSLKTIRMFKIFELILEIINWLKIVASPLIIGVVIGAIVYGYNRNNLGLSIGITIALCGLIVGVKWATRVWKTQGTTNFFSRLSSSMPEPEAEDEQKLQSIAA